LWHRNSRTDWNRPRQWEEDYQRKLEAWNVRRLYRSGAVNKLVKAIDK
jgi:hypothetical protein